MSTPTAAAQFIGDIPRIYDAHLGPIIFQGYADDLARRAAALGGTAVLEIAAGTGISTLALRSALPTATRLVATDLNPPMLEIAKEKLARADQVEFRQADAMALPFDDKAFDLVVIQFGVMFFPDKTAALAEARRVLKPGGVLLFNVWATMAANPFGQIAYAAGEHFLPDNPPKFYQTPFGYADIDRARADLAAAGFGDVTVEAVRLDREVGDFAHFSHGLIEGNPMIADLQAANIKSADVCAWTAEQFRSRFGQEPARMPIEAIVYTARL